MKISGRGTVGLGLILVIISFSAGILVGKNRAKPEPSVIGEQNENTRPSDPELNLNLIPGISDEDHIRGNREAEIILIEYSDYECPFCKNFHSTMQQVMDEYDNKVAWVFRHYPLPFHEKAMPTARAAEAASELGGSDAFWQMTDRIYEEMPNLEVDQLTNIALDLGLDPTKFASLYMSGNYDKKIKDQMETASKAGISGTPGTVIIRRNGQNSFIPGALPLDQVKQLIDQAIGS